MKAEEFHQALDALLDGDCSEADFLRLEAEMHVNPEARQLYYDRIKLHTALSLESENHQSAKIISFPKLRRHLPWISGIAAAIAVLVFGWLLEDKPVVKEEPAAAGFGVVAEQSNAVWNLERGDLLPQGLIELNSGVAQLDLFSGVTVIFEGEAEFEVHSAMEISVHSGKLRAIVPKPARGFRVRTQSGDIVDLGTEFAIDVSEQHADLHVLNGEIEWHPKAKPMTRLIDGESIRWNANGELSEIPADGENFAGINELEGDRNARRDAWAAHSQHLRKDPRLLAYYPMDQTENWNRQLLDESGAEQNGVIVRAQRVSDRWGQSYRALDFSPTGSRVRLSVPGEHSAITLYCWVRIDSLDRWYNSLFLTDGHELQEPHWQIMDDGRLFFSVKKQQGGKGKSDKHIAYSPPIWNSSLSGQWMQIASVYDSSAKTTTHYVNGEQISQDRLPDNMVVEKVRIGAASIGNWSEPMRQDPHFAVRNLNGAIDEFAIFSAALNAEEIRELYEIGKP